MANGAPKREVYKVISIVDASLGTSSANIVLHTAEESETLVRTIFDLTFNSGSAAGSEYGFIYQRAPNGNVIAGAGHDQNLDDYVQDFDIMRHNGMIGTVTTINAPKDRHLFRDLKSQRKLEKDDTLVLSHVAEVASNIKMYGIITMFFKVT